MSIQERNKPFDTTSLETIVGKDAELFNADVSHKPNYKLIDCSPIGMARTETWGGKGENFKNLRTSWVDQTTGDRFDNLSINRAEINIIVKTTRDGTQEICVTHLNPIASIVKGYSSAIESWDASGKDILKIRNGVERAVTINPQGVKTNDRIVGL